MVSSLPLLIAGPVIVSIIVLAAVGSNISLQAQNATNVSNLTGIKNTTTSAGVTARLNVSPPELEPGDYPTPKSN